MNDNLKNLGLELKKFEAELLNDETVDTVVEQVGQLLDEKIGDSIKTGYFFLAPSNIEGKRKLICQLDGYFNMYRIIRNQIYAKQLNEMQDTVHFEPFLSIDMGDAYFGVIDSILEPHGFHAGYIRFKLDTDNNLEINIPGFDLNKLEPNQRALLSDRIIVTKYSELDKIQKINSIKLTTNEGGDYIGLNDFEAHSDYTFESYFSRSLIAKFNPAAESNLQFRSGLMTVTTRYISGFASLLLENMEAEDVPEGIEFYSLRFGYGDNPDGGSAKSQVQQLIGNLVDEVAFKIAEGTGNYLYIDYEVIEKEPFLTVIEQVIKAQPSLELEVFNGVTGEKVIFDIDHKLKPKKKGLFSFFHK